MMRSMTSLLQEALEGPARIVILLGVDMNAICDAVVEFRSFYTEGAYTGSQYAQYDPDSDAEVLGRVNRRFAVEVGDNLHPSLHQRECEKFSQGRFVLTTNSPLVVGYFENPEEVAILRHNDVESPYRESQGEWTKLLPAIGCTVLDILTGAWFDMSTTYGPETLRLLHGHQQLYRQLDEGDPNKEARMARKKALQQRIRRYAETSVEEMVLSIAHELEEDPRFSQLTSKGMGELRAEVIRRIKQQLP